MSLFLIFAPFVIAFIVGFGGSRFQIFGKYIALILFGVMLGYSLNLLSITTDEFTPLGEYLRVDKFNFTLTLAVDRLSAIMLTLSSALLILVTLSSWSIKKQGQYFALLILFSGAIMGVFSTTNLLWFFIFWELTLVPMFFLVGIWGAERRVYASIKFFLYTHFASVLILLAFFLLYKESGEFDFSLIKESMLTTPALIWWLFFAGFAVKMPIFPFHTWLPDAHVEAPAPISVLLAGVLLKMGAYGMIRFAILMMPQSAKEYYWIILALGLVTIFYAGFMALYEKHLKKMVAYSSISHMGFVTVAIATISFSGLSSALFEMIGHALIISPLFLIAGFLHKKTGSWYMQDMGGLMQKAPVIATIFVVAGLGALGFVGSVGFIGELTILIASIKKFGLAMMVIAVASIVSAGYIIWSFRRVIYGQISPLIKSSNFKIDRVELLALFIFSFLIIYFGLFPSTLFDYINVAFERSFGG